jgi:hypothetical protein
MSPLEELCQLLKEANVEVTFSINCRTGYFGQDGCNCWRCRKSRGEEATEETEKLAAAEAAKADAIYQAWQREWFRKNRIVPNS